MLGDGPTIGTLKAADEVFGIRTELGRGGWGNGRGPLGLMVACILAKEDAVGAYKVEFLPRLTLDFETLIVVSLGGAGAGRAFLIVSIWTCLEDDEVESLDLEDNWLIEVDRGKELMEDGAMEDGVKSDPWNCGMGDRESESVLAAEVEGLRSFIGRPVFAARENATVWREEVLCEEANDLVLEAPELLAMMPLVMKRSGGASLVVFPRATLAGVLRMFLKNPNRFDKPRRGVPESQVSLSQRKYTNHYYSIQFWSGPQTTLPHQSRHSPNSFQHPSIHLDN